MEDRKEKLEVLGIPGTSFSVDDLLNLSGRFYFATSMARDSRMTITFT
jgi:hypothetical protein